MTGNTIDNLEHAIRDELRSQARSTPSGAATKLAVLQAIAGQPITAADRQLRRWTMPLLAAAAVVLVSIGLTVGARALNSSHDNKPAHRPTPTAPKLPAPKPAGDPVCSPARGETLVNGAQTSYRVSATGLTRYVFEYYCAGSDGHRSGSSVQVFDLVKGAYRFYRQSERSGADVFVLSLTGGLDGYRSREATEFAASSLPSGDISEVTYDVETGEGSGGGSAITPGCGSGELTVALASAQLPVPHPVLQLTNHSKLSCALWGVPRYVPLTAAGTAGKQPVRSVLRGPAGGVDHAPAAPLIVLQPGATAGASIGADPASAGCQRSAAVRVSLPNGLALGTVDLAACNFVAYPLVQGGAGSDFASYPTTPLPAGPSKCADGGELELTDQQLTSQSGDALGMVLMVKLVRGPSCTVSGYPDVQIVSGSGRMLARPTGTPRGFFGGLATGSSSPPTVILRAGQTASALLEWQAAAYQPTSTCTGAGRVKLTFGFAGATFSPTISKFCDLTVHPFVAGSTGS